MIIGTCGYIGTGSSAVTDLLKEYSDIYAYGPYEFALAYCPDGLEDLDYQLNTHITKHLSSSVALERFRRVCYFRVVRHMKTKEGRKKAEDAVERYIESLVQVKWRGFGSFDHLLFYGKNYRKFNLESKIHLYQKRFARRKIIRFHENDRFSPVHTFEFSVRPEQFLEKTQQFVSEILDIFGIDRKGIIALDQPFTANDPMRSYKYFPDECKAIVVDRDPRDKYVAAKYARTVTADGFQTPVDNVKDFVEYYKKVRTRDRKEDDSVLRLSFEHMLYDYGDTVKRIENFCGISRHDKPFEHFDPKKSIANTQIYKRFPQWEEDIRYIEKELGDWLFPFEKYGDTVPDGKIFF